MRSVRHKFRSKSVQYDGIKFDSTLEGDYYLYLKLLQKAGNVVFFTRQTAFHLPGGTKYLCDFVVYESDGNVRFIDVKGVETDTFKIKKREVEAIYPIEIEIIKKGDF